MFTAQDVLVTPLSRRGLSPRRPYKLLPLQFRRIKSQRSRHWSVTPLHPHHPASFQTLPFQRTVLRA